jgi:DNA-binding GntR family transcriptional regulator
VKKPAIVQTKTTQAYKAVRKMLIAGDFSDTHTWSLRSLSKHLGMSVSPVLGALRRLEQQGLVVVHPQRGITTRALNRRQVAEAYIVREALEVQAARLLAISQNTEAIKKLERSAKTMLCMCKKNDIKGYAYEDFLFHRHLVEGANCEMLLDTYDNVALLCMIIEGGWHDITFPETSSEISNHIDLVKSLAHFNPEIAEKAIRAHINSVTGRYLH